LAEFEKAAQQGVLRKRSTVKKRYICVGLSYGLPIKENEVKAINKRSNRNRNRNYIARVTDVFKLIATG
jgi:hypothetical protein